MLRDTKVNVVFISLCQTVEPHLKVFVMPLHQSGTYYHLICELKNCSGFQNWINNIHVLVSLWMLDRLSSVSEPPVVLALYKLYLLTLLIKFEQSWSMKSGHSWSIKSGQRWSTLFSLDRSSLDRVDLSSLDRIDLPDLDRVDQLCPDFIDQVWTELIYQV